MGRLTTHILDTATGKPASGVEIVLYSLSDKDRGYSLSDKDRRELARVVTNADGRVDGPIAEGEEFCAGNYELVFEVGVYFDRLGLELPDPKFLDSIVLRFGISEPGQHYHVPLLVSPFGYSTYRGS